MLKKPSYFGIWVRWWKGLRHFWHYTDRERWIDRWDRLCWNLTLSSIASFIRYHSCIVYYYPQKMCQYVILPRQLLPVLFIGKSKEASHQGEPNKGETLQSLSLFQSTRAFSIKYKFKFFLKCTIAQSFLFPQLLFLFLVGFYSFLQFGTQLLCPKAQRQF